MASRFIPIGAAVGGTDLYARVPDELSGNALELYAPYDWRDEATNEQLQEVGVDRMRDPCFVAVEVVDGELELPRRSALFGGGAPAALAAARAAWAAAGDRQKWRLKGTWDALGAKLEAGEDPRVWYVHIAEPAA